MSFMKFKFLSTFVGWVVLLWKGFGILSCDFSASVNMIIFYFYFIKFCIQFSHSVISECLWLHSLQHARLSCPSPTLRACSNSCPLSQWCHPTISSSVVPFSSYLQSFPTSGSFKWVHSLHQGAKVLEFQCQHQSFQWIFRTDFL